jgi:NAD(P)-dependent dehydrogenase (short-subunit alcohol dehydrogenase family)
MGIARHAWTLRYEPMTGIQWAANYLRRKAFSARLQWRLRKSARVIIIVGAMGNIGRRLMQAFPNAVGIDRMRGADLVCDLRNIDYDAAEIRRLFESADGLIHLATSSNVDDLEAVHWRAVAETARLVEACARYNIRRIVLPSSGWAEPKAGWPASSGVYGQSKRAIEALATMYSMTPGRRAVALRIGWIARDPSEIATAGDWLRDSRWDDARLIAEIKAALGD